MSEVTVMNRGWDSNQERRVVVVYIGEEDMFRLFREAFGSDSGKEMVLRLNTNLPKDVEVISTCDDWVRRCVGVMLRHDSFDPVPDGCPAPVLNGFEKGNLYWETRYETTR